MIKGINLDYDILKKELSKYKLIITFNGSTFDLPFIRKIYDILPSIPHIDLRHCCQKIGLTGGLKQIEKTLDINRNIIIERFHGGDALTLWRMYKATGDSYYLDLLVEYNEDEHGELAESIWRVIQKLPENEKEIILLREFQEMSYQEIADLLEIPMGTVMSRLYSARKKLAHQIDKEKL